MTESDDPLGSLVARSVGGDVQDVHADELVVEDGIERKRLRFTRDGRMTTALFERSAKGTILEAQLLPFLARKTATRAARALSRASRRRTRRSVHGFCWKTSARRRAHVMTMCSTIIRAKIAIERAVAADGPALRALGVPGSHPVDVAREERGDATARRPRGDLVGWPVRLVHGDLTCGRARRVERGIVLTRWSMAHLGCASARRGALRGDLRDSGRSRDADAVVERYVEESGGPDRPCARARREAAGRSSARCTVAARMEVRAGQTVAAAKAVEESPDSTGQGSG